MSCSDILLALASFGVLCGLDLKSQSLVIDFLFIVDELGQLYSENREKRCQRMRIVEAAAFFRCKNVFFLPHRFFCLKHVFFHLIFFIRIVAGVFTQFFIFSGKCEEGTSTIQSWNLHSKNSVCKKIGFCLNFSLMLTRILASEKLPFQAISSNFEDSKHFEKFQLTCRLTDIPKQRHLRFFGRLKKSKAPERLRRLKAWTRDSRKLKES